MRKVLVYDYCLKVTGHRLPYAALVADSFRNGAYEVVLAIPDLLQDLSESRPYLADDLTVDFFPVNGTKKPISKALDSVNCLGKLIQKHKPDLVCVPTADGLAPLAFFSSKLPWSPLRKSAIDICLMRGNCRPEASWFKRTQSIIVWWLTSNGPWKRIQLIDPRAWFNCSDRERFGLCPDPVPKQKFFGRVEARKSLGLPETGRLIVSVGGQNKRKGSDYLLRSFALADLKEDEYLVFIGRIDATISSLIDELKLNNSEFANRLIVRDEFVSEDEFQQAIIAADIVAAPYRSVDRPSGIVCRSLGWGRPLLLNDRGWLKWINDQFQVGFPGNPSNTVEFASTIRQALDACEQFARSDAADNFVRYNTEENYRLVWRSILEPELQPFSSECFLKN